MADKSIGELPVSPGLTDDALLVVYQNGETESIEGSLIKQYARESTKQYVEGAKQSAAAAAGSAAAAQTARKGVEEYEAKAKASADAAASSAGAAQASAGVADAAKADVAANAAKAKVSADNAKASETASKASETAAGKSATDAEAAKRAAQAAQTAAETAKRGAEGSATAAGNSATQAGQSATAAAGSAGAAAQSATAAGSAKAGAEGARDTAVTAKNDAETAKTASEAAKTAAEAARDAAKTSETNAKASETEAAGSKSAAETAAQTATAQAGIATTKAGEAATSAGKAKTSETNSKASETAAKGSETAAAGSAGTAKSEADRAKSEADRAATIVGGDFPTKAEAQGYVNAHDTAQAPHAGKFDPAGSAAKVDGKLTTHTGDAVKHVTAAERTAWNAKETTTGAQSKADAALTAAKKYADGKSAYQQAVEGGYKGTEAEFKAILGSGPWLPTTGGTIEGDLSASGRLTASEIKIAHIDAVLREGGGSNLVIECPSGVSMPDEVNVDSLVLRKGMIFESPTSPTGIPNKQYVDDVVSGTNGVTSGSATAYTLAQPGFALKDGVQVRVRLHTSSGAAPTLNVNGTGAKKIVTSSGKPMPTNTSAGAWITLIYSSTLGFFILQGSGGDAGFRFGNKPGQISTFQHLIMHQGGVV